MDPNTDYWWWGTPSVSAVEGAKGKRTLVLMDEYPEITYSGVGDSVAPKLGIPDGAEIYV